VAHFNIHDHIKRRLNSIPESPTVIPPSPIVALRDAPATPRRFEVFLELLPPAEVVDAIVLRLHSTTEQSKMHFRQFSMTMLFLLNILYITLTIT